MSGKSIAAVIGITAAVTCVCLGLLPLTQFNDQWHDVLLVVFFGTCFGQSLFAAIWSALGPAPIAYRMPTSLVWIGALCMALFLSRGLEPDTRWLVLGQFGPPLLAYWLVIQILLLILANVARLRIVREDPIGGGAARLHGQFTNQQLLLITTTVGLFLGATRFCLLNVRYFAWEWFIRRDLDLAIWMFIAAVVLYPAIYASTLSNRAPAWFILGSIFVVGCEGVLEVYLVSERSYSTEWHESLGILFYLFCGHVVATAWILIFGLFLRSAGYRLRIGWRRPVPQLSAEPV